MRALPLHQPWAGLVACGAKRVETRSRRPPVTISDGSRFAIYAAKTREHEGLWDVEPFKAYAFEPAGNVYGALVATAVLGGWAEAGHVLYDATDDELRLELAFGDFSAGRFAWFMHDVRRIAPIPRDPAWGGGQGIFIVPDDVIPEEARA